MQNRSRFLALTGGAAAAALGVPGLGLPQPAFAQDESDTCYNPAPGKTPVPYQLPPVTSVSVRKSAFDPTYDWALLRKAYAKMKSLDPIPGSGKTPPFNSMAAQRNMHAWFCATCSGTPNDIHFSWSFMPWHRGFLYFHERILGSLAGDMSLRLPYWDWEVPARTVAPPQYYDGPLMDPTRFLKNGQSCVRQICHQGPPSFMQPARIGALMKLSFSDFAGEGGANPQGGTPEVTCHGFVHNSTGGIPSFDFNTNKCLPPGTCDLPCDNPGGDMSDLNRASRDPIFYAHHANIDRLWWSWENYPGNVDAEGAFREQTFAYYDEKGNWVSLNAGQMIPAEKTMGYRYSTAIKPATAPVLHQIPLALQNGKLAIAPDQQAEIKAAKAATLNLRHLVIPGPGEFQIRAGGRVVGEFSIVSHGRHKGAHKEPVRSANISVPIAPGTAATLQGTRLTIVPAEGHAGPLMRAMPGMAAPSIGSVSISVE
ncbi:MAG TPA: tyrosinase family protein [Candidatus Elarobacter sp.]